MGRSSLLSLLRLLLLLGVGQVPSPGLARCVPINSTHVNEGEETIIAENYEVRRNKIYVSRTVRFGPSFRGVGLTATAETETRGGKQTVLYRHFISRRDWCFTQDRWMTVAMWVDLKTHSLVFRIYKCLDECTINNNIATTTTAETIVRRLTVTAHGSSTWNEALRGDNCRSIAVYSSIQRNATSSCEQETIQAPTTPSTPSHSLQPAPRATLSPPNVVVVSPMMVRTVVVSAVVVSVLVVTGTMVVVMVVCCRKKRNTTVTGSAGGLTHHRELTEPPQQRPEPPPQRPGPADTSRDDVYDTWTGIVLAATTHHWAAGSQASDEHLYLTPRQPLNSNSFTILREQQQQQQCREAPCSNVPNETLYLTPIEPPNTNISLLLEEGQQQQQQQMASNSDTTDDVLYLTVL